MQKTRKSTAPSRADLYREFLSADAGQEHFLAQGEFLHGAHQDFELYSALDYSIQTTVITDTRALARTA